ncbi:MAG: GPMC system MBL fold metallohydrolase [Syntrophotaleaceae bacterium]
MAARAFQVTLLGSGTSTGVPMLGCDCEVCRSSFRKNHRTRCSALITCNGRQIVIDTSTDFRQQALRAKLDHVDAVLYTHAHADHIHGIDDLRAFNMVSRAAIPIFGTPATMAVIRSNFRYIFSGAVKPGFRPQLIPWEIGGEFMLCGLPIQPVPLRHGEEQESCGYRIGTFAYLTDCNGIPDGSLALLRGLDVLVIDGLRFRSHPTHFSIPEAIEIAAVLGARRTVLTHINHEVEHRRDGASLPKGVELAYDGQQFRMPVPQESRNQIP